MRKDVGGRRTTEKGGKWSTLCHGTDNACGAVPCYIGGCRAHTDDARRTSLVAGMEK